MKSIILFIPYGGVGGIERLAVTFYNHFKTLGHSVKVVKIVALANDVVTFGDDEIAISTIDLNQMSVPKRFLFYAKISFMVNKIAKKEQATDVIAFGDMANLFLSLSSAKARKTGSIHSFKSVEFRSKNVLNWFFKKSLRWNYHFLDKLVCISKEVKRDLIENCGCNLPDAKLPVIYNPHPVAKIRTLATEEVPQSEKYIFDNPVVLFLGRITGVKAVWELILSFSELLKKSPNTHLVFVGDGDEENMLLLKKIIAEKDIEKNVFFLGRKNNPYIYLKRAAVLALTSHYEGTPNVIVEAIALGIPIVTTHCTNGILELMSAKEEDIKDYPHRCDSGWITTNFLEDKLGIPEKWETNSKHQVFADALYEVLKNNESWKQELHVNQEKLLTKFDVALAAKEYLKI